MPSEIYEIQHPLIKHHLSVLRDKVTPPSLFRAQVNRLTTLLTFEATRDLSSNPKNVVTPVANATCQVLAGRVAVIPILRAGLGMVDPVLDLVPTAEVWHLGYYRDEQTLQPVEYYAKLPPDNPPDVTLLVDPMLATGGSACAALKTIYEWGVPNVKLLTLIAAPEGIDTVQQTYPNCQIYTCSIDDRLNEKGYIIPGLGDAGDRIFNASPVD